MSTDGKVVVTVDRARGRVQYSFPVWWSVAAVVAASALAVLGVVVVQAGWFR